VRSGLPKLRSPFPFFLPEPAVKITVICKNNFHKQFVFFFLQTYLPFILVSLSSSLFQVASSKTKRSLA
jgi:hypothetical protein